VEHDLQTARRFPIRLDGILNSSDVLVVAGRGPISIGNGPADPPAPPQFPGRLRIKCERLAREPRSTRPPGSIPANIRGRQTLMSFGGAP